MLNELAKPSIGFGSTECSACRVQMEDVARKRTLASGAVSRLGLWRVAANRPAAQANQGITGAAMMISVQLFARARELLGAERILLAVPEEAVVADVRRELARMYPNMAGLVHRSAVAMNDDIVEDHCVVTAGAELALLPPVSGGSLF